MSYSDDYNKSRLLVSTEDFRTKLINRNLYNPIKEYNISNIGELDNITETINNVIGGLTPFKSFNLKDTVIGRSITYDKQTPITTIGLAMLGKHLALNSMSHISQKTFPSINLSNLFNNSNVISNNSNYTITPKSSNFQINSYLNTLLSWNSIDENPLQKEFTLKELLDNTGKSQLNKAFSLLSLNRYRDNDENLNKKWDKNKILKPNNYELKINNQTLKYKIIEYNSQIKFNDLNNEITTWDINNNNNNKNLENENINGILKYTHYLSNNNKNLNFDKKSYSNDNNSLLNGSGIFKINNSEYSKKSKFYDGVRQHNLSDKYDKYQKAIRFIGNSAYSGNENSVIYKTVKPRINPIMYKNNIDNKNLMFSIENLAIKTSININNNGIIDDIYRTEIPKSEVGPNNGRIMWFPPYGLDIQETSTAKYDNISMVGRNEPIYTYLNSERSATISFMLIIDYPPNVKKYKNIDDINKFFIFGGENINNIKTNNNINITSTNNENNKIDLNSIYYTEYNIYFPNDEPNDNNIDTIFNEMFNKRYEIDNNIKVSDYNGSKGDINSGLYVYTNEQFIIKNNEYIIYDNYANGNDQYNKIYTVNDFNNKNIDNTLNSYLNTNIDLIKDKKIIFNITGYASALHTNDYNNNLGMRRAKATKILIESRLKAFNVNVTDDMFKLSSKGESNSNIIGDSKDNETINKVKLDRYSNIKLVLNNVIKSNGNIENNFNTSNIIKLSSVTSNTNNNENEINTEININDYHYDNNFNYIINNKYYPVFHSQTPEDFHKRLTFLQQCLRQGSSKFDNDQNIKNSVFGRQPICILRIGDFFHTKIIIESLNIDYNETVWDMNPEGFGMQPMIAMVTLNVKLIGGQSLKGPINALQNAVSFNYYANSTFTNNGLYKTPKKIEDLQYKYNK